MTESSHPHFLSSGMTLAHFQPVSGLPGMVQALACTRCSLSGEKKRSERLYWYGHGHFAWHGLRDRERAIALLSLLPWILSWLSEQAQSSLLALEVLKASSSLHVRNPPRSVWNSLFHWASIWIRQQGPHIDLLDLKSTIGCLQFLPPLYEHVMFPAETNVQWSDNINVFLITVILITGLLSIPGIE